MIKHVLILGLLAGSSFVSLQAMEDSRDVKHVAKEKETEEKFTFRHNDDLLEDFNNEDLDSEYSSSDDETLTPTEKLQQLVNVDVDSYKKIDGRTYTHELIINRDFENAKDWIRSMIGFAGPSKYDALRDFYTPDDFGFTPIERALVLGQEELAEMMLMPKVYDNHKSLVMNKRQDILERAINHGHAAIIPLVDFPRKLDKASLSKKFSMAFTVKNMQAALFYALFLCDDDKIINCIDAGAAINYPYSQRETVIGERLPILKQLLVNIKEYFFNPENSREPRVGKKFRVNYREYSDFCDYCFAVFENCLKYHYQQRNIFSKIDEFLDFDNNKKFVESLVNHGFIAEGSCEICYKDRIPGTQLSQLLK